MPPLLTIGYEGRTVDELLDELCAAGIQRLVDVRELPLSRKRGMSKTPLSQALATRGIEYVHVRAAGNPFRALKGDLERCLGLFREHIAAHPEAIDELEAALAGRRSAMLCYERDPSECHRSILIERLLARRKRRVVHL